MSSGGRSRAAALALLLGVIVVLGAIIIVPTALYWSHTGNIIEDARLKTQRAEKRTEASATLERTKAAWDSFAAEKRAGFVLSSTDEEGIEEISARIEKLFIKFNGTFESLPGEATEGPRAGVRQLNITGSGVISRKNLGPFLTALEGDPAFLIVSEFKARKRSKDLLTISFSAAAFRLLESDV